MPENIIQVLLLRDLNDRILAKAKVGEEFANKIIKYWSLVAERS